MVLKEILQYVVCVIQLIQVHQSAFK